MSRPVLPESIENAFLSCYLFVYRLDNLRKTSRPFLWALNTVLGGVSVLVAHFLWLHYFESLADRYGISGESTYYLYHAAIILAHLVVGAITFTLLRAAIPLVLVAQRGVAVHALGLTWASVTKGEFQILLRWYLKYHPETDRVRVICLSGLTLFGSAATRDEHPPLWQWAQRGNVDVIMPSARDDNPTVCERWNTYSPQIKAERYSGGLPDLTTEIKDGKAFLHEHRNVVTEHDILCFWRVVLLQHYCLVQNYFPNLDGGYSDDAPTFVYRNTGKYSYYQTYLAMFELLKQHPRRQDP